MRDLIDSAGSFKKTQNMVVGAEFEPTAPYLVPTELKDMTDNLYFRLSRSKDNDQKLIAILQSHIGFEQIHPFSDGNGRVGRILMIYSCLEQNMAPIVIPNGKDICDLLSLK